MTHQRTMWKQWLTGLCVVGAVAFLLGCEAQPNDECGGVDDVVACASVTQVSPTNVLAETSFQVDVIGGSCFDTTGLFTGPEPFSDHFAEVTFRNDQFPNSPTAFPIVISFYRIEYEVTDCPPGFTCPALDPFESAGQSVTIQPGAAVTQTFFLVPVTRKAEFNNEGGTLGVAYRAHYTFRGSTAFFTDGDIEITGNVELEFNNYNLCS